MFYFPYSFSPKPKISFCWSWSCKNTTRTDQGGTKTRVLPWFLLRQTGPCRGGNGPPLTRNAARSHEATALQRAFRVHAEPPIFTTTSAWERPLSWSWAKETRARNWKHNNDIHITHNLSHILNLTYIEPHNLIITFFQHGCLYIYIYTKMFGWLNGPSTWGIFMQIHCDVSPGLPLSTSPVHFAPGRRCHVLCAELVDDACYW